MSYMKTLWAQREAEQARRDYSDLTADELEDMREAMDWGYFTAAVDRATPFEQAEMLRYLSESLGTKLIPKGGVR